MSDSLRLHGPQHARLPRSFTISWTLLKLMSIESVMPPPISSSVVPFSSCLPSFPASGSFPVSQFFASSGQSIRVSASILPVNIQSWFPLGLTGLISLLFQEFSRVFSSTTVWKHQVLQRSDFFIVQFSHLFMTIGKTVALTMWYNDIALC